MSTDVTKSISYTFDLRLNWLFLNDKSKWLVHKYWEHFVAVFEDDKHSL